MQVKYDCSKLAMMAPHIDLIKSCDIVKSGAVRFATPFKYPNGEAVDLFLYLKRGLLDEYQLSDYGQTYVYLSSAQTGIASTSRKREIVGDITSQLRVKLDEGELIASIPSDDADTLSDAILRLGQACVRISDLATHQRLRSANPFRDDVEDFFEARRFSYIPDVKIDGPYKAPLRVDFEVNSTYARSYVNVLAAMNLASARSSANDIFVKWHDLIQTGASSHQLVTIYNSASRAIRTSDVNRLKDYSIVVSYPEERESLEKVLAEGAVA